MTLNATILSNEINSAVQSVLDDIATNPEGESMTSAQKDAMAEAYAGAIIDHIKSYGVVTVSTPSGPGTGTIS